MNKWSSFPAIIGFETNNQYEIKNSMGQKIFHAKENTDCCTRNICGPLRSFELQIKDNFDQEVIHLNRPYRCTSCCYPCCLQEVTTRNAAYFWPLERGEKNISTRSFFTLNIMYVFT